MEKKTKLRNIDKYIVSSNIGSDKEYEACIEDYMDYYDKRSKRYKGIYYVGAIIKLMAVTSIPILEVAFGKNEGVNIAVLTVSAIAVFCETILSKIKAYDKYLSYRNTCNKLSQEQRLYKTNSGSYKKAKHPLNHYVKRVEKIIENEGEIWEQYMKKQDKQKTSDN